MKRTLQVAVVLLFVALPASAQMELIGRFTWMSPDASGEVEIGGNVNPTRFESDNETGYGAAFNVFWTEHISTELAISWVEPNMLLTEQRGTRSIDRSIKTTVAPVTAIVQYHFAPDAWWEIYLGAGAAWTLYDDAAGEFEGIEDDDIARIELEGDMGFAANLGFNLALADNFYANIDAKYVTADADATFVFGSGTVSDVQELSFDPLIVSVGVGWRF